MIGLYHMFLLINVIYLLINQYIMTKTRKLFGRIVMGILIAFAILIFLLMTAVICQMFIDGANPTNR
jgi:hypothetical protein